MTCYHAYNKDLGTLTFAQKLKTYTLKDMAMLYDADTIQCYTGCAEIVQTLDLTPEEAAVLLSYMVTCTGLYML